MVSPFRSVIATNRRNLTKTLSERVVGGVTSHEELWEAVRQSLPREEWLPLALLYNRVRARCRLDDEDFLPSAPGNDVPKWKRNVRNVLQHRKQTGEVEWNRAGSYRLAQ